MRNILCKLFCFKKIRKLKKEIDQLRIEKKHLTHLMDNLNHHVYFKDDQYRFTRINKLQAHVLGVDNPEEAIGKTDFDFFTPEHAKQANIDEQIILKTGKPVIGKVENIRHSSGKFIWVTTSKSPIMDENNKPIGIVGVTVDITEKIEAEEELKKAKEKAEESDRLKSAFLVNMSHEIRTPMNGIIGFSQLLKDSVTATDETKKYIDHIDGCANTLLSIIENIIDISKIESGDYPIHLSPCPLNMIMDQVYQEYAAIFNESIENDLRFTLEKGVYEKNFSIHADAKRLKQIMVHLLDNAFKFTASGSIHFGYRKLPDVIEFYVKDTGIGISKENVDLIFDHFGQITDAKLTKPKGTGLGLSISSKLVHMMGGKIWVDSKPGEGSTFYFNVPYQPTNYDEPETAQSATDKKMPDWRDKSIIVAEDEEVNWLFIQELLRESNANLLWARNGQEALDLMEKYQHVDLVLMDLKMPVLNGHDTIEILKSNYSKLPIIAQTANALEEEKKRILHSGCDAYLVKPLDVEELISVMQDLIA